MKYVFILIFRLFSKKSDFSKKKIIFKSYERSRPIIKSPLALPEIIKKKDVAMIFKTQYKASSFFIKAKQNKMIQKQLSYEVLR